MAQYTCPCCGYKSLETERSWEICPICFWEDDPLQFEKPDYEGGANSKSLRQAQENYQESGACEAEMKRFVRPPFDDEEKDPDWKPLGA